jgi:hypothetical protein
MLSIFILCAGSGERWNQYLGVPKQMIPFGNETLIERTLRLLSKQDQRRVVCVVRDSEMTLTRYNTLSLSRSDSLAETILATRPYWSDRNMFFLGDVFFSERAVERILSCERRLAFFGRPWPSALAQCGHGEMFGFTFGASAISSVQSLIDRSLTNGPRNAQPNLWNLYQLAGGLPLGSSRFIPRLLVPIDDYTNDIDTPIDYLRRGDLYESISLGRATPASLLSRSLRLLPNHRLGILRWWMLNGQHRSRDSAPAFPRLVKRSQEKMPKEKKSQLYEL